MKTILLIILLLLSSCGFKSKNNDTSSNYLQVPNAGAISSPYNYVVETGACMNEEGVTGLNKEIGECANLALFSNDELIKSDIENVNISGSSAKGADLSNTGIDLTKAMLLELKIDESTILTDKSYVSSNAVELAKDSTCFLISLEESGNSPKSDRQGCESNNVNENVTSNSEYIFDDNTGTCINEVNNETGYNIDIGTCTNFQNLSPIEIKSIKLNDTNITGSNVVGVDLSQTEITLTKAIHLELNYDDMTIFKDEAEEANEINSLNKLCFVYKRNKNKYNKKYKKYNCGSGKPTKDKSNNGKNQNNSAQEVAQEIIQEEDQNSKNKDKNEKNPNSLLHRQDVNKNPNYL